MNENQEIQEINQEVAETALDVSRSNNVLIIGAVAATIGVATAVGVWFWKRYKKNKETVIVCDNIDNEEITNEEPTEE